MVSEPTTNCNVQVYLWKISNYSLYSLNMYGNIKVFNYTNIFLVAVNLFNVLLRDSWKK